MDREMVKQKLKNVKEKAEGSAVLGGVMGFSCTAKAAEQTADYAAWLIGELDSNNPENRRYAEEKAMELIEAWTN